MIHILKNETDRPIGWELVPTNDEERAIAAIIRDLVFFGIDEQAIEYNGIKLIDPEKGKSLNNLKSVSWVQKKYQN